MASKNKSGFGIIGLGRFGTALANFLAESDQEVMVIDENESNIRKMRDKVQEAFLVGKLTTEALEDTGINECDTVIVCISKVDVSVLTTQMVLEMGVPRVISKADNREHGMILEKIGADVVYPELETAIKVGAILLDSKAIDLMRLNDGYVISEIKIPQRLDGISIEELNLEKYKLKLIAIEIEPAETWVNPKETDTLKKDDAIVVIGKFVDAERFERHTMQK